MHQKRVWATLLVISLCLSMLIGCGKNELTDRNTSQRPRSSRASGEPAAVSDMITDLTVQVKDKKESYPDTVGWLQIPGTSIDDVVVSRPEDGEYYERRNLDGEYDFNGVYYTDYRSKFGNGTSGELGLNTCIYGHAMTDNEDREQYAIRFGPLHDYRNPEYAKSMPYIQFSTGEENMVFEVFAVFTANSDNPALPYNRNDIPPGDFIEMIEKEVLPRSLYHYEDMTFSESDHFLTLSTCIYTMPDGTRLNYETSNLRYAVMAKLVDPSTPLKAKAAFEENKELRLDPDGPWPALAG